jgi:hypothetical protein
MRWKFVMYLVFACDKERHIFISLFFQWVISSNSHIDIQVLRYSLSDFYHIFQIISFEIIPCFHGDCTSTLCVFNYCIPKIQHFSYEMMIVFHKTLFWNVVVWRMIEMKHFSFFFNIKLSKRINWWKIYFSRGNNFHHFRKRRTQNMA